MDRVLAVGGGCRRIAPSRSPAAIRAYAAIGLHPGRVAITAPDDNLAALAALIKDERGRWRRWARSASTGRRTRRASGAAARLRGATGLAAAAGLPVLLHSVGAHAVAAAVLDSFCARLPAVVVHYFAGDAEEARRWLGLGCPSPSGGCCSSRGRWRCARRRGACRSTGCW
ncbi:MAG: TatD family hydrolase [Dehalococcoidia bacterium]